MTIASNHDQNTRYADNKGVAIIYSGGTLASYGMPRRPLPWGDFRPILQHLLAETSNCRLDSIHYVATPEAIDSSQLTPAHLAQIYEIALSLYRTGYRQLLVLTGTDTLSHIAAVMAECFARSDLCLIVTGSMQPLLSTYQDNEHYQINKHSDALDNLLQGYGLACHGEAGVRVCFAGEDWAAQTVQKIHTQDVMAFSGHQRAGYPANSYQKMTSAQRQYWLDDQYTQLEQRLFRMIASKIQAVFVTPQPLALLENQISDAINSATDGIILLGYGAGNVPDSPKIRQLLTSAYRQGCLIVISSQVPFGGVNNDYAAGQWLADCHILSGARLTLPAIYARLLWLTCRFTKPSQRRQQWTRALKDVKIAG